MYTQHISIHIHCCLFMCLFNSNGDSRSGVPGVLQQRWDLDPNAQLGLKHSNDKLGLDQKAMGKFMAVDFWHCKIQQTVAKKKGATGLLTPGCHQQFLDFLLKISAIAIPNLCSPRLKHTRCAQE